MLLFPAKLNRFAPNAALPNGGAMVGNVTDGMAPSDEAATTMDMRPSFSDTVVLSDATAKTYGVAVTDAVITTDWTKVKRKKTDTDFKGV